MDKDYFEQLQELLQKLNEMEDSEIVELFDKNDEPNDWAILEKYLLD